MQYYAYVCKFLECSKPYGAKPSKLTNMNRNQHHCRIQVKIPSSKKYAVDRVDYEAVSEAVWCSFESIVIDELCKSIDVRSIDITNYTMILYITQNEIFVPYLCKMMYCFEAKQLSKSRARLDTIRNMLRLG